MVTSAHPTLGELLAPLACALDLGEGLRAGHAARTALLATRIADVLGHDPVAALDASLLQDAGGPATAAGVSALFRTDDRLAKRALRELDLVRRGRVRGVLSSFRRRAASLPPLVRLKDEQGAQVAAALGLPAAAAAVGGLGERWDGRGPRGLAADEIPAASRVVALASTVEIFLARHGIEAAFRVAVERSGAAFDPAAVAALLELRGDLPLWAALAADDVHDRAARLDPGRPADVDRVCAAFARIADSKSVFRLGHSTRVAELAAAMAAELDLDADTAQSVRRAALLHDLGLLGRSSPLLEKRGPLTALELAEVRRHPIDTERILRRVPGLGDVAALAATHQERLDGSGYPRGLTADRLPTPARVLALANAFEALTADRPWRPALAEDEALSDLRREAGTRYCPAAFGALERSLERAGEAARHAA